MILAKHGLFVLLPIFILSGLAQSSYHNGRCNHVHPKPHEVIHGAHIEPFHVIRKRSADQPLRILLHYHRSVYELDEEKFRLINNTVLPEAVNFWQRALMVRKTENVIRLNRKCENHQALYRKGYAHSYCKNACEKETMCGEVQVPEDHLDICRTCDPAGTDCKEEGTPGRGIEGADFVFYVSAMTTERCTKGLTVAYAAHCQLESALDRPIAGHANFCPESISTKPQELDILLSTVKHEILHALGFSISLFAFYRDPEGNPLTPREENGKPSRNPVLQLRQWSEKVIKKVVRTDWTVHGHNTTKEVEMIVTPRVVQEVRDHFNCSMLEGAELEDQGGEGTVLTHWEKRLFENEAMTGTHTQNPVYSRITLALMEDTGWYTANYSMADPLSWGKNLGCDFAMKSCKHWMDTKRAEGASIHPFCDKVKGEPLKTECTNDRTSVALCNLVKYSSPLPRNYQNFDSIPYVERGSESYYGGSVSLSDYCPYIQEFNWRSQSVIIRGSQCQYPENNPQPSKNFALEEYGEKSKCFDHTDNIWKERTCTEVKHWQHWGSGCYNYDCHGGRLHIKVGNYSYTCFYPGQELTIRILVGEWLHMGSLICPPCEELCKEQLEEIKEWCKPPLDHVPENFTYHADLLPCKGRMMKFSVSMLLLSLSVLLIQT